ncbi:MAG TPA: hypothetical protein VJ907_02670 [Halanaerobiales bacterium]|nr:hypothetical protein [Halanaerobiales bacterium]
MALISGISISAIVLVWQGDPKSGLVVGRLMFATILTLSLSGPQTFFLWIR